MKFGRKLKRREFARAIRTGHGRVIVHLHEYGDKGVSDEIKKALLKNYSHSFWEGSRLSWLRQILLLTGRPLHYGKYLLDHFHRAKESHFDLVQQFELGAFFFDLGIEEFRPRMMSAFHDFLENMGWIRHAAEPLFDVAGLEGLAYVARLAGADVERVQGVQGESACNRILEYATDFECDADDYLEAIAFDEPNVANFMDACKRHAKRNGAYWIHLTRNLTLQNIVRKIEDEEEVPHLFTFRLFGRRATEAELISVYELLKKAKDPRHQLAYLQIFSGRALPESTFVLQLLNSMDAKVRHCAAVALSHTQASEIRSEALALMRDGQPEMIPLALQLLIRNYRPEDAEVIRSCVKHIKAEDVHSAGLRIQDLWEDGDGGNELTPIVLWFYERTPDSYCRRTFLEQLVKWNSCPESILYEAQWDSGTYLQTFARFQIAQLEKHRLRSALVWPK